MQSSAFHYYKNKLISVNHKYLVTRLVLLSDDYLWISMEIPYRYLTTRFQSRVENVARERFEPSLKICCDQMQTRRPGRFHNFVYTSAYS